MFILRHPSNEIFFFPRENGCPTHLYLSEERQELPCLDQTISHCATSHCSKAQVLITKAFSLVFLLT